MIQGAQEVYRVYWDDYRKVDKLDFAHKVVVKVKSKKQSIIVKYSDVTINKKTGERVDIGIDAYTLLPKSLLLTRGTREIYRIYWDDYKKVDELDFAHKVVIKIKSKNQSIVVSYSDVMINQGISLDAFELALGSMN